LHGAVRQCPAYAADVEQVSVFVCVLVVLILITLSVCVLNLGKLCGGSGLNTGIVSVENWWYRYYLFLLLVYLLIRDVAELEEMSSSKSDKILSLSVLLACKQVELIECTLPSLFGS
jgi:hypothetical protein